MQFKKAIAFVSAFAMLSGGVGVLPVMNTIRTYAEDTTEEVTPAPNGTQETALALTSGKAQEGAITATDTELWYSYTAKEAGSISINFDHASNNNSSNYWSVTVYQEKDGILNQFNIWSIAGNKESTVLDTLGVSAGNYLIKVTKGSFSTDTPYTLTLNFTANSETSSWESEFNEDVDSATEINVNQPYQGLLHSSADIDYYTFTTEEDGYFTLDFLHDIVDSGSSEWSITLYKDVDGVPEKFNSWDAAGNKEVVSGNNSKAKVTTTAIGIPAGKYYISIEKGLFHSNVPYEITVNFSAEAWETEFNNDSDSATEIEVGKPYSGTLYSSSDMDYYQFSTPENGKFTIDFNHDEVDNNSDLWTMTIYKNEDGKLKKFRSNSYSGKETDNTTMEFGVPAGEYYIQVEKSTFFSASKYTVQVNYEATETYEKEFNDYDINANPISANVQYSGSITNSGSTNDGGDEDWYSLNIPADTTLTLQFEHDAIEDTGNYWHVELWKDNAAVEEWDIQGTQELYRSLETEVTAGDYLVKITSSSYHHTTNTYHFNLVTADGVITDPNVPSNPSTPSTPSTPSGGLFGDINGDGAVNAVDASLILQYAAEVGAGNTSDTLDVWVQSRQES